MEGHDVAFEIAAAVVEKYVGTSLLAIQATMAALHDLNRRHLAEHWNPTTDKASPVRPR